MDNKINLTQLSRQSYDKIYGHKLSVEEALDYLHNEIPLRTFADIIKKYNISQAQLTDTLLSYDSAAQRDSVSRKVRDWYRGAYEPASRIDYIMICFALGLDEVEAELMLRMSTGSGFHLRSVDELTYAYGLRTGKTFRQTNELYASLPPVPQNTDNISCYTETVALKFRDIYDDDAFRAFIAENVRSFGTMHNTAYKYFKRFIDILQDPGDRIEGEVEGKISIESILDNYLRMGMPNGKKTPSDKIAKMLKKYWPGTTNIRRMLERTRTVYCM